MTLKEAIANFVASEPREITGSELDAWQGLEGDGYIAEIPAPLGGEETVIVLDVKPNELHVEVYGEDGTLESTWTLEVKHSEQRVQVYDNGGITADRYTVVIGDAFYAMSENAMQPNGVNVFMGTTGEGIRPPEKAYAVKLNLKDVPYEVRRAIAIRKGEQK